GEGVGQRARLLQLPPAFQQGIGHVTGLDALDHRIDRAVEARAEDREDGLAGLMIDGIVAPFAAGDAATITGEKLAQFVAIEEDLPGWAALVGKSDEIGHSAARLCARAQLL